GGEDVDLVRPGRIEADVVRQRREGNAVAQGDGGGRRRCDNVGGGGDGVVVVEVDLSADDCEIAAVIVAAAGDREDARAGLDEPKAPATAAGDPAVVGERAAGLAD